MHNFLEGDERLWAIDVLLIDFISKNDELVDMAEFHDLFVKL